MDKTERHIYIAGLISKLITERLSTDEQAKLDNWIKESDDNRRFFDELTNPAKLEHELEKEDQVSTEQAWENMRQRLGDEPVLVKPVRNIGWFQLGLAASLLIAGALALILHHPRNIDLHRQSLQLASQLTRVQSTHQPILILGNGHKVVLNKSSQLSMREKDGSLLSNADSTLKYDSRKSDNQEIVYNTIVVPRGGQYQLILADGSKVWINSASSLRYPTAFSGKTREVYLDGEAYFEVAHNANSPFKVKTARAEVQVLGTHFNVNAYQDEAACKTTLLEGSVEVKTPTGDQIIKPGQQDVANSDGSQIVDSNVNLEEEVAWKNGLFFFKDAGIQEIMRQACRWYDLKVAYEGPAPDIRFTGKMSRKVNAAGLINILKYAGFHIREDGKTIYVTK
jgi:ferric-dicitrate binding protein FerR (iron transport regulator)